MGARRVERRRVGWRPTVEDLESRRLLAGELDPSFGVGGMVALPGSGPGGRVAVQGDGKVVALVGNHLVRVNADGSPDTGFGPGGVRDLDVPAGVTSRPLAVAVEADGAIVAAIVAKVSDGPWGGTVIARFGPDGSPDQAFGDGGRVVGLVESADDVAAAIGPDGAIVEAEGTADGITLARYLADGRPDAGFGNGGTAMIAAQPAPFSMVVQDVRLALQGDGKVVVGALVSTTDAQGQPEPTVALMRVGPDGRLDAGFGTAGRTLVAANDNLGLDGLAVQGDGKILVTDSEGYFVKVLPAYRMNLYRFNPDGRLDESFQHGAGSEILFPVNGDPADLPILVQPADQKILAVGASEPPIRLNPDGTRDLDFGPVDPVYFIRGMAVEPDGKVVVVGGYSSPVAARYLNAVTPATLKIGPIDTLVNATVTVSRFYNDAGDLTVHYATDGGSARPGVNYTPVSGTLHFAPGEETQSFVVPGVGMATRGMREVDLVLSDPTGGAELADGGRGQLVITNRRGRPPSDFNGDTISDLDVYDPQAAVLYHLPSVSGPINTVQFGIPGGRDVPVAADFDGDGKADLAVYDAPTATFFASLSGGGSMVVPFGIPNGRGIPIGGDFDGDGLTDLAVYDPVGATFFVQDSSGGGMIQGFGIPNGQGIPIAGDYDGDLKTDLAVYDPVSGTFFIKDSSGGGSIFNFGIANGRGLPIAGDYDGDFKTDIAVYDPISTNFFIRFSGGGGTIFAFGVPDGRGIPLVGNYVGGEKTDVAVYDPISTTFFIAYASGGGKVIAFGVPNGQGIPSPSTVPAPGVAGTLAARAAPEGDRGAAAGDWLGVVVGDGGVIPTNDQRRSRSERARASAH